MLYLVWIAGRITPKQRESLKALSGFDKLHEGTRFSAVNFTEAVPLDALTFLEPNWYLTQGPSGLRGDFYTNRQPIHEEKVLLVEHHEYLVAALASALAN